MGKFKFIFTLANSNKQKKPAHRAAFNQAVALFGTGCCSCCKFIMGLKCTYTDPWMRLSTGHDSTQRYHLSGNPGAAHFWKLGRVQGGVKCTCPLSKLCPKHLLVMLGGEESLGRLDLQADPGGSSCTCPRLQPPEVLQSNFILHFLHLPLWRSGTLGHCQASRTRLWQTSA